MKLKNTLVKFVAVLDSSFGEQANQAVRALAVSGFFDFLSAVIDKRSQIAGGGRSQSISTFVNNKVSRSVSI